MEKEDTPVTDDFEIIDDEVEFTRNWFAPNDDEHRALLKLSAFRSPENSGARTRPGGNAPPPAAGPPTAGGGSVGAGRLEADPQSSAHFAQDADGETTTSTGSEGETKRQASDGPEGWVDDEEEEDPDVETPFMICPLTSEVMTDPVITSDGMTYEREAIENWMKQTKKNSKAKKSLPDGMVCLGPTTQIPITHELKPNIPLRDAIAKWRDIKKEFKKKVKEVTEEEWEEKFKKMQEVSELRMEKIRAELAEQEEKVQQRDKMDQESQQQRAEQEVLMKKELAKDYVRHWQRDSTALRCIHCQSEFGKFRRKHHCRNCGYIFCHACCSSLAQIEGVTNKVAARVKTPSESPSTSNTGSPTPASVSPSTQATGAGDSENAPAPLERVCVRCALMFSNTPSGSDSPAVVVVPPSFRNYFHLNQTQLLTASMGDSLQAWSEYVKANAPVAGQWAKDTTVTMAQKMMAAWTIATNKVTGK